MNTNPDLPPLPRRLFGLVGHATRALEGAMILELAARHDLLVQNLRPDLVAAFNDEHALYSVDLP